MHNIEIITRAVIKHKKEILLNYLNDAKGKRYYFLPGGHLEFGETTEECLRRELREELGASIASLNFLTYLDNFYTKDKINHQEINLLFTVKLDDREPFKLMSQEGHISIKWLSLNKLKTIYLLPGNIQKFLINKLY